jgi:hypothetical protein
MKDIDRMIRQALSAEDAEVFGAYDQPERIHEVITELFRMRPRALTMAAVVATLAAMAAAVWAAINFFTATEPRAVMFYGLIIFVCIVGITAVKIWAWVQMGKNSVLREVKRLELQIAHLVRLTRDKDKEKGEEAE